MSRAPSSHVYSRIEQGFLVLTITERHLRTDKLADALRQELILTVEQTGLQQVVIDMQHVESLSSTGLRPLLGLYRHLLPVGGRLVVCNVTKEIARVFSLTRLVGLKGSPFHMEPDLPAALALLAGGS